MTKKKQEDMRFMGAVDAALHMRPSAGANLLFFLLVAMVLWALYWTSITEIEERSRGQGQVMPSSDMQVMQSLDAGIVEDILVKEGEKVAKGQILLRMENVQFNSENRGIEAQKQSYYAKRARLLAESKLTPISEFKMPADIVENAKKIAETEMDLLTSRYEELALIEGRMKDDVAQAEANKAEVQAAINKLRKSISLLDKELKITEKLLKQKAVPEIEKIRLERELNNQKGDLSAALQSYKALDSKLKSVSKALKEKRKSFQSEALGQLNEVEMHIKSLEESAKTAQDRVRRTEMKSPVDGVVQRLAVKTIGGVIEPAQKLIEIVPVEDDLLVRAKMMPSDIAFLRLGMPVRVSLTAYDPQIYGRLMGQIERISADSVVDQEGNHFFEIDIRTEKNYLGQERDRHYITPGMIADVEVITGKRTILTYLLRPVLRARDHAFTQR